METSGAASTSKETKQVDEEDESSRVIDVEVLGVFCWLMKDLGWCLLLGAICFPAAALAIFIESKILYVKWNELSTAVRVHNVVLLLWLIGNTFWMIGELNFAASPEVGRQFLWYHEPYLGVNEEAYTMFVTLAQFVLCTGVVLLLVFYASELWQILQGRGVSRDSGSVSNGDKDELVFGWITPKVYEVVFVGPWIIKDLCWTADFLWGGLLFGSIVLYLVVDCYRRFRTVEFIAEICWVVGNIVWICAEDLLDDKSHWPRVTAGCSLFCGCLITVYAMGTLGQSCQDDEKTKLAAEKKSTYS